LDWQRGKWGKLASYILKKGEEKAAKYADEIIVLSKNTQLYFKKIYNRETTFIPNGTNPPKILEAQAITEKWQLQKDGYILFLARIVPEKGLHYLIKAWKEVVKRTHTDKKLVIAGASSHSDEYYDQIVAQCCGDESIVMTGFVEGQELQELYSNAYLYVLPSDIEGMPMSLLEAMSYGDICLVSDIPENKEVITQDCYTFQKGNVADLTDKLTELIEKNLETHIGATVCHTWQEVAERTLEVYRK
jgi:glycosyltransferase involved in cell wall biosynthesis